MSQINTERQTRKNFYVNICAFVVNIIVGIYYTPYLVHHLGLSAYGIIPLALIVNQYISIASGTLTSSFTRFYSIDIQKGSYSQANKDLITSFFVVCAIILFCLPGLIFIIVKITSIFEIPSKYINNARLLFIFTILSFFISLITSLLNVTLYAQNRLDLITTLNNIRNVSKFVLTIILFESIRCEVQYVGLASLITELFILLLSVFLFRKFKPKDICIEFANFDKVILFAILGMSIWTLLHQIGDTFIYRSDNLVINHFWGTNASGAVGVVSEFGSYIKIIVNIIGSLFGPLVLFAYSRDDHDEVIRLSLQQSLIVGCLAATLAGICSGLSSSLLSIWINPDFSKYHRWLIIKMMVIPFYASGGILALIYRAWNKVKIPALLTVLLGLINLVIIITISNFTKSEQGITIVLVITAIVSIVQCYIINFLCVKIIYKEMTKPLIINFIKISLTFLMSMCFSIFISSYVKIAGVLDLILYGGISGVISLFIIMILFFSKDDRQVLRSLILKK